MIPQEGGSESNQNDVENPLVTGRGVVLEDERSRCEMQ
jgi:hypothetical protein